MMQPGDTIQPGGAPANESKKPEIPQDSEQSSSSDNNQSAAPKSQWQFTDEPGGESAQNNQLPTSHENISWTASEYIAHDKNPSWYMSLMGMVIAFSIAVYFLTHELISPIVIAVMGLAFGMFAARKPQELTYVLSSSSLKIGDKDYHFSQFKSFTIIEEGAIHSIMLMPLQRFMPPLSVYFDPADEDKIVDALSSYLPYEDRKQDYIDKLMSKVRF